MRKHIFKLGNDFVDLDPEKILSVGKINTTYLSTKIPEIKNLFGKVIQEERIIETSKIYGYGFSVKVIDDDNGLYFGDWVSDAENGLTKEKCKEIDEYREKIVKYLGWEINPDVKVL